MIFIHCRFPIFRAIVDIRINRYYGL
jgi:hypothetical protein